MQVNSKGRFVETYSEVLERMRTGKARREAGISGCYSFILRLRAEFGECTNELVRQYTPNNPRFRAMILSLLTNGEIDGESID